MFKMIEEHPTRLDKLLEEFEAVKGLARDNFNDFFVLTSFAAFLSLIALIACVEGGGLITFTAATLVVISGLFFVLYWLGELKIIYPRRFKILYKRKKE